jgi:hypothetical protein
MSRGQSWSHTASTCLRRLEPEAALSTSSDVSVGLRRNGTSCCVQMGQWHGSGSCQAPVRGGEGEPGTRWRKGLSRCCETYCCDIRHPGTQVVYRTKSFRCQSSDTRLYLNVDGVVERGLGDGLGAPDSVDDHVLVLHQALGGRYAVADVA